VSGARSRRKGQEGEREVCGLLTENLGEKFTRNLDQARDGGGDVPCGRYLIEVKRVQQASLPAWWRQAVASAKRKGKIPALWYRADRKPWRVVVPLPEAWATEQCWREGIEWTAEISPAGFYLLAREGV
jgi:hypothetical protein